MLHAINNGLSASMAYGRRMGNHAERIAAMDRKGVKPIRPGPPAPLAPETEQTDSPARSGRSPENETDSEAGEGREMTEVMIDQKGYAANLAMVDALDESTGTVLDLLS